MPHPAQINYEQIVTTARALFEAQGSEGVSMAQLAAALGVKAPSLYKHVADKDALLQGVNTVTMGELTGAMLAAAGSGGTVSARCMAMAEAYWDYAHAHPVAYTLATTSRGAAAPDPALLEGLALPLQAVFSEGVGEGEALVALRGAWALLHGYVALALGGQFRRGGDVRAAYLRGFGAYLAGWGIVAG